MIRWYIEMNCEQCGRMLHVVTGEADTHEEAAPDEAREMDKAFEQYRTHRLACNDGSNVGGRVRFGERQMANVN